MAKKNIKEKGFFITVEGLEGSGKSSVIKSLTNFIKKKGFSLKVHREPGSTRIGEKIRKILLDNKNKELSVYTELLLYLAARTQLIEEQLKEDLLVNDFVVCDRFFDSTLVYQGYALGLGEIVHKSVQMFSLGVNPDLTIVLDTPVKKGLSRLKSKDRIESRPLLFHNKLRKGYLLLAKKYPERIKIINARNSLAAVCTNVHELVEKTFL
ncbi:MAG: dTMP kinase [Candidatus Omnitrophica bacterium]|nr:dTMP kinase [Candidatus Omnitrophota bacterium]MCK5288887.1 dTMP kinase [Candidatus Omnitrophota bacterium]MCK5392876.1 dTMP kinase [Candidatus Omnitrophota bacterium]